MVMILWSPLRRWWQAAFEIPAPASVAPVVFRPSLPRRAAALATTQRLRPVTPFRAQAARPSSVEGGRRAARRFWMTLDPDDQRRAAIGGSFAEVCAALERLAAVEEQRLNPH